MRRNLNLRVVRKRVVETSSSLREHAIIELMRKHFTIMPDVVVPFGDDVSAIPLVAGEVAVLKTDMLIGKTDIPKCMSLWQAARKAVTMNVSDLAAKGVAPLAVLVSLGLPGNVTSTELEELAQGLDDAAREYGTYVVGGDTGEACDLVIAVNLFGVSARKGMMLRSGVRVGDVLAVTGLFGKPAAGLKIIQGNYNAPLEVRESLMNSVYLPVARLQEGLALRHSGAITGSIDSSDGLAWCLHELAAQSKVGFFVSTLPVADEVTMFAEQNGLNSTELALYGGEEYELVVTVDPRQWAKAEKAIAAVGGRLLPIGKATSNRRVLLEIEGKRSIVEARGYEHFMGH